ncbi:exported hypothetical protein [Capnocytophaga cynodegmi]|nr:exported hypothetical protein [Capnocytophaga cynodegmi]
MYRAALSFLCFTSFCKIFNSSASESSAEAPDSVLANKIADLIARKDSKATVSLAFIASFNASITFVCKLIYLILNDVQK